ncbi:unnamed protein product, partial [Brachionus calyciflorus]
SGIIDRKNECLETIWNSPDPQNCSFYSQCVNGFYYFKNCPSNQLFDPFKKQCSSYSACYHGCKTSNDKVGILLKSNIYYDCQTKSFRSCKDGWRFDLKEKNCLRPLLNNVFEFRKFGYFSNVLLAERNVLDKRLCLN